MPSPNEITVSQLSRLIGLPEAPMIIDVCIDEDFNQDPRLIPTAVRHPFTRIGQVAAQLQDQRAVIVCHRGKKLSQGAAAVLRDHGVTAEFLEGGVVAWREAAQPLVPLATLPGRNADGRTVWVTRHRPKVDRIACPWLIRRFIDPSAQFLFVAPTEVRDVAEEYSATPFDIEDVHWSHRGELCTFDVMVDEFGLATKPLKQLAGIVRGADTNRHDIAPEAAGLLAASLGLSRMYRDDLAQLNAGMALYDAFYRWCRDATDEGHDWPPTTGKHKP